MNRSEFYNEPLLLPGAVTNPARYKLPSELIRYPLELPTLEELPVKYELPQIEDSSEAFLPGLEHRDKLELSSIPAPYRNTVRYIHSGISPRFSNGYLILSSNGRDIHHIVKRSYVQAGMDYARDLLPFNGAIKQTFDMMLRQHRSAPKSGNGNLLINLIPLDYSFHHRFIEERPYDHSVRVRFHGENHVFTLPELLMGFNIFNLNLRFDRLWQFIERGLVKAQESAQIYKDSEFIPPESRNVFRDVASWEQMLIELPRIPIVAEEIQADHPILYSIWEATIGPLEYRRNSIVSYEQ